MYGIELEQDGVTSTLSSTGIDTADPKTWKIGGLDLVRVAHRAFAALSKIPELNAQHLGPCRIGLGQWGKANEADHFVRRCRQRNSGLVVEKR
jgi:hypothetical protein